MHTGLVEDVYLNIASGNAESILLDVSIFPLMWLLWLGGFVVVAGGAWSIVGPLTRPPRRPDQPEPTLEAAS